MANLDNHEQLSQEERIERVRQAVIRRNGNVTVGDIVVETGFSPDVAEQTLRSLITTHEGVMRVSETGEIMYAFTSNCISRDYRSWWQRSKDGIYKAFKLLCKILIMLVLVIYFIIYLAILLMIIFGGRNNNSSRSSFNFNGMIWLFWGSGNNSRYDNSRYFNGSSGETPKKKDSLYNKIFHFIFGPEDEKSDPMQLQRDFAALVKSRQGVITAEDWMVVSGHTMSQAESEIARYTAIYDGDAHICKDGTLVYVFKDMMKSASTLAQHSSERAKPAWERLENRKPLTGNSSNVSVILLNLFNLIMAFVCLSALNPAVIAEQTEMLTAESLAFVESAGIWLGIIPLIFSVLVFAGPLLRLPGNIKENNRRRRDNIRRVVLENVDNARTGAVVNGSAALRNVKHALKVTDLGDATVGDINGVLDTLAEEMHAERAGDGYRFGELKQHSEKAEEARKMLRLGDQNLGRVIFSTDSNDTEAEKNACDVEMEEFDEQLGMCVPKKRHGGYDTNYSSNYSSNSSNYSSNYSSSRRSNYNDFDSL